MCEGGYDAARTMGFAMPSGLHRTYGAHHLHFITCPCYRRLPFLSTARSRDLFLSILEKTRQRYQFVVVGYVVMPEHAMRIGEHKNRSQVIGAMCLNAPFSGSCYKQLPE